MANIIDQVKLDYNNVVIMPKRGYTNSRGDVDLIRTFTTKYSKRTVSGFPIIAANMDTTGTFNMARSLTKHQMFTALNKHYNAFDLFKFFSESPSLRDVWEKVFYTIGIQDKDLEKLKMVKSDVENFIKNQSNKISTHDLMDFGFDNFPNLLCVDVANGYSQKFIDRIKVIREEFPKSVLMAGNIVTPNLVETLIEVGVDICKIGIGPGSVCTTRIETGVGYPQLSAVLECADAAHGLNGLICADGGCVVPGDVCKAFGGGADFVMLGGMFAGTDECEGIWEYDDGSVDEYIKDTASIAHVISRGDKNFSIVEGEEIIIPQKKKKYFTFYGMSSKEAKEKYNGTTNGYESAEGKCVKIPYKGTADKIAQRIKTGVIGACSMTGTFRLKDLSKRTTFVRVNQVSNEVYGKNNH